MGAFSRLLLVSLDRQRPLTTALELITAGIRSAWRLPEQAGRFSLLGVEAALSVADTVRREYRTVREDGWGAALAGGRHDAGPAAFPSRRESALGWPEEPADRVRPASAVDEPAPEALAAGAPGAATTIVERAEAEWADELPDAATLDAETLPVPDYDHLTLGSLRARMRRLSLPELLTLREYEKNHANRLQVVTMLDNRVAKLEAAADSDTNADTPE